MVKINSTATASTTSGIRLAGGMAVHPLRGSLGGVVSILAVVLLLFIPSPPVASAVPLFNGFDATCQEAWSCAGGGYSAASGGWPDKYYSTSDNHNCNRYVAYRLKQNGLGDPGRSWGNARDWDRNAPGNHDSNPAVGSIAWWNAGSTVGGPFGHVAYVEEVGDGYFVETEDNAAPYSLTRRVTVTAGTDSWPDAFLHIKDAGGVSEAGPQPVANPQPQPAGAPSAPQSTGVYVGTIGMASNRVPATLTLNSSDPIAGTIDLPGICTAVWTESQRLSDSNRIVEAHVTSGTDRCMDNQWAITVNPGQISGVDTSHGDYTVSLSRR